MTGSIEGLPRIVHLNVGGTKFQTSRETLLKWRNEKLDAMFAGENDAVLQDDDGSWFIDRDGDRFRHVLAFMRAGMLLTEDYEPRELRRIAVDADFFGLDELKQVCDRALGDTTEQSYSNPGSPREVARPNSGLDMPSSPALATNSQAGKPDSSPAALMAASALLRAGHNYRGRGMRATDSMLASGKPNIFIFQRAAKRGDENLTVVDGQTLHIIRQLSIPTDTPFFGECGVMGSGDKRCVLVYFSTMSDENKVVLVDWANSTVLRSASWPCARLCADPLDDTHFGLGLVVDEGEATYVKVQALNCSTFAPKSQREFVPSHPVRRQRNSSTMVPRLWNTPLGRVLVCVYLEGGRLEAWVWDWQEDEVVQHLLLEETAGGAPAAVASFVPLSTHKTFLICSQAKTGDERRRGPGIAELQEKNKGMWFWDYKTNGLASYTRRQTGTKWIALGDSHIAFFDMGLDSAVTVVDMLTGEVVREFPHRDGHKMIDCCALGERHLVLLAEVESAGNSIRVVDFRTGEVAQSIQNPELHYQGLDRVQAVDDKLFLVLPRTTHGCRARVFDSATGTEISRWDSLDAPWGTLTPIQGTSMAVGSFLQHRKVKDSKPRVVILDYKKGTELQSFESEVQVAFKALQEGRIVQ